MMTRFAFWEKFVGVAPTPSWNNSRNLVSLHWLGKQWYDVITRWINYRFSTWSRGFPISLVCSVRLKSTCSIVLILLLSDFPSQKSIRDRCYWYAKHENGFFLKPKGVAISSYTENMLAIRESGEIWIPLFGPSRENKRECSGQLWYQTLPLGGANYSLTGLLQVPIS